MSGTDIAYQVLCHYAVIGTEIGYAASPLLVQCAVDAVTGTAASTPFRPGPLSPYAMRGTGRTYAAIFLCACYAMSGTDIAGAKCDTEIAHPGTPSSVLRARMVLRHERYWEGVWSYQSRYCESVWSYEAWY
eukprot:1282267-Rhodomonas_salina.2